jgi:hypothetical protein
MSVESFDFVGNMLQKPSSMREECDRTRLIAELASLLRECELPDEARTAGLTLIGYLARRMPGEGPSQAGVAEVRAQAEACSFRFRRVLKKRIAV